MSGNLRHLSRDLIQCCTLHHRSFVLTHLIIIWKLLSFCSVHTELIPLPKRLYLNDKSLVKKGISYFIWKYHKFSFFFPFLANVTDYFGALRYRGGLHPRYIFRGRRGLLLRPLHVRDFVKEGYFFVRRYEVWGVKIPLQSTKYTQLWRWVTPELTGLPSLLPLNTQRILNSKVKICVPVHPMSVFW